MRSGCARRFNSWRSTLRHTHPDGGTHTNVKRYLAWDIETFPTAEALLEPYPAHERHPPSNYTKEDTIAEWRRKDAEKWEETRIKEYSFSPRTARIVALSLNYRGGECTDLTALDPADEKSMIEDALTAMMDRVRVDLIVGFNSREFDWPFLMMRAMYHRIDLWQIAPRTRWHEMLQRYSDVNVDVRDLIGLGNWRVTGTLSQWSAWAGEPEKDTHGGQIYEWCKAGDIMSVMTHCRGDARRTGALFERVYPLYKRA